MILNGMDSPDPEFLPVNMVRRLRSYSDDVMRRALLRDCLKALHDEDILALLGYLICQTDAFDSRRVYLDLLRELVASDPWDADRMAQVEKYPAIRSRRPVLAFLAIDHDARRMGGGKFGAWAMDDVPLGVRKSRARSTDLDTLAILTGDPDFSVINILLDNPKLTEILVLRIAAKRPQKAEIFRELLESRFIFSEVVQSAVVNNPYCPTRIAVALVPLLSRMHRVETSLAGSLDRPVCEAAAAMNVG
jgi:hypothetical protein